MSYIEAWERMLTERPEAVLRRPKETADLYLCAQTELLMDLELLERCANEEDLWT
jgi:hypothetical protein